MEYKKPKKLKLKSKLPSPELVESEESDTKLAEAGEEDLKMAPMPKGEGKLIIRKAKKPVEPNIIDARGMTREAVKEELQKKRLKRELKIKKMIEGM